MVVPATAVDQRSMPVSVGIAGIRLSARDSARVLELLEHPPKPTAALRAAARRLRRNRQ
jgi:uncharacterized protein (DUF1778 family)